MTAANPHYFFGVPDWQAATDRRLNIAMLVATIVIVTALSLIRIRLSGDLIPLSELVVHLIADVSETAAEPERRSESEALTKSSSPPISEPLPEGGSEPQTVSQPDVALLQPITVNSVRRNDTSITEIAPDTGVQTIDDWHEFGTKIVQELISNPRKEYTVNPPFDEKRRIAAIRFRPSEAPIKREPWDDIEKDQLGRTILRNGNCFQILDDPSAVNREIFETFDQHMVYCTLAFGKAPAKELPWVNEVRERYAYLRRREEQRRNPDAF